MASSAHAADSMGGNSFSIFLRPFVWQPVTTTLSTGNPLLEFTTPTFGRSRQEIGFCLLPASVIDATPLTMALRGEAHLLK